MRGLRLVMGLVAIEQAVTHKDWVMGLAGGWRGETGYLI